MKWCPAIALCSIIASGYAKAILSTHKQRCQSSSCVKSAMPGRYMNNANQYFEEYLPGPKRTVFHTRKGLSWRNAWGVLRYSANNAFIAFVHADQMKKQVVALAQHDYILAWRQCGNSRAALRSLHSPGPQLIAVLRYTCMQGDEAYAAKLFTYATSQINYMLGDGGQSYVIGFGKDSPTTPFHKW